MLQICDNIFIENLSLFLKKEKILIISDIHIGYEEELNTKGILIPRFQQGDILNRIEEILKRTKPNKIIINGDLKHEFGNISETEWRNTFQFLDLINKYCKEIILIKGNHDTILEPIVRKRNLSIKNYYKINSYYIIHGNKIPRHKEFKEAKVVIIGNEHPAISLKHGIRSEIYKCFLKGKFKNKTLIVIPSFNPIIEGTNILKEELLSPFLHQDLTNFNVYIIGDKVYDFGKIKNIK